VGKECYHLFKMGCLLAGGAFAASACCPGWHWIDGDLVLPCWSFNCLFISKCAYPRSPCRMEAMLKSGLHPIDIILLLACSENDTPKV
jgi:hypothetical protein